MATTTVHEDATVEVPPTTSPFHDKRSRPRGVWKKQVLSTQLGHVTAPNNRTSTGWRSDIVSRWTSVGPSSTPPVHRCPKGEGGSGPTQLPHDDHRRTTTRQNTVLESNVARIHSVQLSPGSSAQQRFTSRELIPQLPVTDVKTRTTVTLPTSSGKHCSRDAMMMRESLRSDLSSSASGGRRSWLAPRILLQSVLARSHSHV